jgi:hypothetical protein
MISSSWPAERTFGGRPQGVRHLVEKFDSNMVLSGEASARSAPMATMSAPMICKLVKAPRTAEPALITSFTIATRFPLTAGWSAFGRRYSTGYKPSLAVLSKRSAQTKSHPSSRETSNAMNAPSTSGPHTTCDLCGESFAASCAANGRISVECMHRVSSSRHKAP